MKGMKIEYAEKDHDHGWISIAVMVAVVFGISAFFGGIFTSVDIQQEIDLLQEEIDSMPHYECWNETIKDTIIIEPSDNWYILGLLNPYSCVGLPYSKITCEDGITAYDCMGGIVNYNLESGVCITETVKEVCSLNKNVNEGVDAE